MDSPLEQLQKLSQVFRDLGATNPESFASSQLQEGIPQLAHFVFLKQAWENIIDLENIDLWFDHIAQLAEEYPRGLPRQIAEALTPIISKGVSREEIAKLIQLVQYDTLDKLCFMLDDGGFASPLNVRDEEWQPVRWSRIQVDDDGNFVAPISALHEYSNGESPDGKQTGFR